jgi:hypothetical protein
MAGGPEELAARLDDLETALDALLDEHAVARSRLQDLESVVSDGAAERERPVGRPADGRTASEGRAMVDDRLAAPDRRRPAPRDEATQAEVERAVQEIELEDEEEEERDGEFIVA